ncbi:hypothetical protein QM042_12625 [Escherichia coli]|uniref:hypothetical protein n=1 Tax=Escherichia coli TaxID=562 RepID=UPI003985EF52
MGAPKCAVWNLTYTLPMNDAIQGVVLSLFVHTQLVDACCRPLAPLDEALQHYVLA